MRTTLNLDEQLVQELLHVTRAKTKTEAIHSAILELIRRDKLTKLKSLSGKVRIDLNLKKRRRVELQHQKQLIGPPRGHC
jgi:Arc/MetJ family transcription regulator